jgi:hypothetical protein
MLAANDKTAVMPLDRTQPLDAPTGLLQQLRDMRRRDQEADVESSNAKVRWLDSVEILLGIIRGFLASAIEEGLARIDLASVHVADDDVGAYDAPALKISFPAARTAWVRPVGMLRVGGQGIVDVVCGSNRALLVLNRAGVWKIRGPGPVGTLVKLDAQSFARAMTDLLL